METKQTYAGDIIKRVEKVGFVGCPVKMTFNIIYQRQNG
jgi:hypothetical protein